MRLCVACGTELLPNKRSHAIYCTRVCKKSANSRNRRANPEKRAIIDARAKAWRKSNPKRAKDKVSTWHKENSERVSYHKANYRYSKMYATPWWVNTKDLAGLHELCRKLEALTPTTKYHVDHIIPLQGVDICGLNVPWNLQIITQRANNIKKNKYDENDLVASSPFSKLGKAGGVYYDPKTTILEETEYPEEI